MMPRLDGFAVLERQAQGGEVLAAERVVAALGDSAITETASEVELKGMTRPVSIHRVTALR